jgi:hypothetical protein
MRMRMAMANELGIFTGYHGFGCGAKDGGVSEMAHVSGCYCGPAVCISRSIL